VRAGIDVAPILVEHVGDGQQVVRLEIIVKDHLAAGMIAHRDQAARAVSQVNITSSGVIAHVCQQVINVCIMQGAALRVDQFGQPAIFIKDISPLGVIGEGVGDRGAILAR